MWHRWGLLVKRSQALRAAVESHTPSKPLRSVKILPFEGDKEAEGLSASWYQVLAGTSGVGQLTVRKPTTFSSFPHFGSATSVHGHQASC